MEDASKMKKYVCKYCGRVFDTLSALGGRVNNHYLGRAVSESMIEQIQKLYEEGYSLNDIAHKLNISPTTAWKYAKIKHKMRGVRSKTIKIPQDLVKIGYAAGLLDGEGSIDIGFSEWRDCKNLQVKVVIGNKNKDLMNWLLDNFGGHYYQRDSGLYQWEVHRLQDVLDFLKALHPYLIIKRELAEKAIYAIETYLSIPHQGRVKKALQLLGQRIDDKGKYVEDATTLR